MVNNKAVGVSAGGDVEGAIVANDVRFTEREDLETYGRIFQAEFERVEDVGRAGAASLELGWVATGRMDAFFEIGLKPWDVAAGSLLVREAGGVVLDFDGNDRVEDAGTIIAAPYKIMTPLRQLIASRWETRNAEPEKN